MAGDPRTDDLPRPLSTVERDVLLAILDARTFPGRDALRAQAETATVIGRCDCGCASVDLGVDPAAPRATTTRSPIPNGATVLGKGGDPLGGIMVFVDDGRLTLLEVFSYEEPIGAMPRLDQMTLR